MANTFLRAQVLPGEKIEHHEHRKLLVALVIVVIIAIVIGLSIWWNTPKVEENIVPQKPVADERQITLEKMVSSLNEAPPVTADLQNKSAAVLSKTKPVTAQQEQSVLKALTQ